MDFKDFLFSGNLPDKVEIGSLLISEPLMNDPYFSRSVILVLDKPEDEGHFGLILNKKTDFTLKELMPEWEEADKIPVYCGGPVDMERMFLLHTLGEELGSSMEITPGIYVGADLDKIISYVENGGQIEGKLRFFLGYCGWAPDQLAAEINANTWAVKTVPEDLPLLSGDGVEFWREQTATLGNSHRSWLLVPTDPSLN